MRTFGGISGFPRREESEYDAFGVGHSSTAISAALGFAVGADDPFAQIVACSGTVGCNSSLADTKHDAQVLALLLDHPCDVQLTACSKSCASARVADYTLVAVNVGAYDLYRRDYVGQDEFGHLIGQGMTVSQAAELMK